jgi:hypothetical protein
MELGMQAGWHGALTVLLVLGAVYHLLVVVVLAIVVRNVVIGGHSCLWW